MRPMVRCAMLDPDIQALVEMGDTIGAIGLLQQRHGGSVLAARKAVEEARWALTQKRGAALDATGSEIDELIRSGNKIDAIKRHRELHNVGLKEAKDAVDARAAALAPAAGTLLVDAELAAAMRSNQKIQAIKRYRELYNVGLKDAKDAVEAIMAGAAAPPAAPPAPPPDNALQPELDRLIAADQKIMAIKHVRTVTNLGLREAKDAVEARISELASQVPNKIAAPSAGPPGLQPKLDRLIRADQKILAIKHYKTLTNVGLKEAKDAVEARTRELNS
jgi:ribosomal protein L7/L12